MYGEVNQEARQSSPLSNALFVNQEANSPLVGFLYSFSINENGHHWPLRMGRMNIGSASDNDVVLSAPDISALHARIVVRKTPQETRIYIKDQESMNGTQVNDMEIFNGDPILYSGDKITIGNVELYLLLINT